MVSPSTRSTLHRWPFTKGDDPALCAVQVVPRSSALPVPFAAKSSSGIALSPASVSTAGRSLFLFLQPGQERAAEDEQRQNGEP